MEWENNTEKSNLAASRKFFKWKVEYSERWKTSIRIIVWNFIYIEI